MTRPARKAIELLDVPGTVLEFGDFVEVVSCKLRYTATLSAKPVKRDRGLTGSSRISGVDDILRLFAVAAGLRIEVSVLRLDASQDEVLDETEAMIGNYFLALGLYFRSSFPIKPTAISGIQAGGATVASCRLPQDQVQFGALCTWDGELSGDCQWAIGWIDLFAFGAQTAIHISDFSGTPYVSSVMQCLGAALEFLMRKKREAEALAQRWISEEEELQRAIAASAPQRKQIILQLHAQSSKQHWSKLGLEGEPVKIELPRIGTNGVVAIGVPTRGDTASLDGCTGSEWVDSLLEALAESSQLYIDITGVEFPGNISDPVKELGVAVALFYVFGAYTGAYQSELRLSADGAFDVDIYEELTTDHRKWAGYAADTCASASTPTHEIWQELLEALALGIGRYMELTVHDQARIGEFGDQFFAARLGHLIGLNIRACREVSVVPMPAPPDSLWVSTRSAMSAIPVAAKAAS